LNAPLDKHRSIERFHQTMKKYMRARRRPPKTLAELQAMIDEFVEYYNCVRPHRAIERKTPIQAFRARTKARPKHKPVRVPARFRVHTHRVNDGNVTLRHETRLYHIAVGRRHEKTRVLMLVAGLDVRILTISGEVLRHLKLDPSRPYQALGAGNRP
jgi:Integrase core domain